MHKDYCDLAENIASSACKLTSDAHKQLKRFTFDQGRSQA